VSKQYNKSIAPFAMRLLFIISFFLSWVTTQAQTVDSVDSIDSKVGLQTIYMPQFNVQEASGSNIQAYGVRWMLSDYDSFPFEFGFQAYSGFGDVSRISLGFNLAYLFAELHNHDFKIGLGLNRIDLEDVDANRMVLGPNVGDVRFIGWGTEFKPYLEWEWTFSRFTSLFLKASYHIINGEKSVVTEVEATGDPIIRYRVSERDWSFFYSASGYDIGVGISIIF